MAFRYLIYSTGTTYAETIVRESTIDDPGVNEASLFSDFVIPEIQPLYLWRVTGGTDVVPNIDSNIENYLNFINPIGPDDPVLYSVFTGYTAQTQTDLDGKVDTTIFNAYTAQTQTDLDGKINIVTGATGNLGTFDVSGNLVDTGVALSAATQDIYVSGMTYVGSTLTLQRTEGLPDLTVTIVSTGNTDGVVSGGTLAGTILSLQRTEGLPDVDIELSGLTAGVEADIAFISGITDQNTADIQFISGVTSGITADIQFISGVTSGITADIQFISGVTSGNTEDIATNAADIAFISGVTDTKLDTTIFDTYTGDTQPIIDAAITGATNGLTASGRDIKLGGTLIENTAVDGASGFTLSLSNLGAFGLSFSGVSTITDLGANGGLRYAGDYSPQFVNRSLVDKGYVDAVAAGLDLKESVRAATTSGNTDIDLGGGTFGGTIDGYTVQDGDRVLVKNQDSAPEDNGIYIYSNGTNTFSRAIDFDNPNVTSGAFTFVETGSTNASSGWVLVTQDPISVGTTPLTFTQFSEAGSFTAGVGIDITSNVISLDGASIAGDNLSWSGTQLDVTGVVLDSTFNSYTAQTSADLAFISGVTDSNTTRIENLESSVSGITGQTYVTEDTFTGYTAATDVTITGIENDIQFISGVTSGNTADISTNASNIATNAADIAFLSGETSGNTAAIAAVSAETVANAADIAFISGVTDTKLDTDIFTGYTASTQSNELFVIHTGGTNLNTTIATGIIWHTGVTVGSAYTYTGGTVITINETGDYEVSYNIPFNQTGGGQDKAIGANIVVNGTIIDNTAAAGFTTSVGQAGSVAIPTINLSLTAGDELTLIAFRTGGGGDADSAPNGSLLIKKKGTLQ